MAVQVTATDQVAQVPVESLLIIVCSALLYLVVCGGISFVFQHYKIEPPTAEDTLVGKIRKSKQFWMRSAFIVLAASIGTARIEDTCGRGEAVNGCDNWHLMFWYGLALVVTANVSYAPFEFYLGEGVNFTDNAKFWLFGTPPPTFKETEKASLERWVEGGDAKTGNVGFSTLMPSVFISWIFAKSIRNAAWLGGRFGMLGGLAYASWYLSFFSAGIVCYFLRTRYNFKSLPTAVYKNYGSVAVILFQFCLFFRLFNEVWSNAGTIGGFYGPAGSPSYWGAAWLSVLIPVSYVIMGGMRASLFSDVFQAGLAVVFLVIVLGAIGSDSAFSSRTNAFSFEPTVLYPATSSWDGGWWSCFLAGAVQGIISYPFFDPVLTDRGFIGTPRTMLASMFVGGLLAALFIFFFAVIGVYGAFYHEHYNRVCTCVGGVVGASPLAECPADWNPCASVSGTIAESSNVAMILGRNTFGAVEVFVNFIMITASMSTLDSTFTSAAKLVSLEFCGWVKLEGDNRGYSGPLRPQDLNNIGSVHIVIARVTMAALAVVGTAFLGIEGDVMQATTAAGTCIMGIGAPIWFMTIWSVKKDGKPGWCQSPLAFIVPTIVGFAFGFSYWANGRDKEGWTYDLLVGSSAEQESFYYSRFLGVNLVGHAVCIGLFLIFFVFHQVLGKLGVRFFPEVELEVEGGSIIGSVGKLSEPDVKLEVDGGSIIGSVGKLTVDI
eukprot:TRINITY_DN2511_c0_g1_i1.p1 TRINITY_DN2511_c0_g1~~TRINITY_DN2511_c0_g1_i1.p1  ORF type:complete len:736 (+),score=96.16 TRINITY_DN2511_c0_g1_i1:57-2210(+)